MRLHLSTPGMLGETYIEWDEIDPLTITVSCNDRDGVAMVDPTDQQLMDLRDVCDRMLRLRTRT